MALSLLIQHELGQHALDLQPRSADAPAVIGRGAGADVPIPSAAVSRRHCLLYVHEGRWAIADAGSSGGTFVNGRRLAEPVYLNLGDEIRLGDQAATALRITGIAVEQDAAMSPAMLMMPAEAAVALGEQAAVVEPVGEEAPAQAAFAEPDADASAEDFAPGEPSPQDPPVHAASQVGADNAVPGEAEAEETGQSLSAVAASSMRAHPGFYVPRRSTPAWVWVVGVVLTAAVVGGVVIALRWHQSRLLTPSKSQPASTAAQPRSIFGPPPGATAAVPPIDDPTTAPPPARPLPDPAPDPAPSPAPPAPEPDQPAPPQGEPDPASPPPAVPTSPAWARLEDAAVAETPGVVIYLCSEYTRTQTPSAEQKAQIAQWVEQAVDRLWWQRIRQLTSQRGRTRDRIGALQTELRGGGRPEFRKQVQDEIAAETNRLDGIQRQLVEDMGWEAAGVLEIDSEEMLGSLRKARDAAKYKAWREDVERSVVRRRGSLPWGG